MPTSDLRPDRDPSQRGSLVRQFASLRPEAEAFRRPEIVVGTWRVPRAKADDITEDDTREALTQLDPLWDELFPAEQARIIQLLVERVDVRMNGVEVRLRQNGLAQLVREVAGSGRRAA